LSSHRLPFSQFFLNPKMLPKKYSFCLSARIYFIFNSVKIEF
jgi:hypothetical protein